MENNVKLRLEHSWLGNVLWLSQFMTQSICNPSHFCMSLACCCLSKEDAIKKHVSSEWSGWYYRPSLRSSSYTKCTGYATSVSDQVNQYSALPTQGTENASISVGREAEPLGTGQGAWTCGGERWGGSFLVALIPSVEWATKVKVKMYGKVWLFSEINWWDWLRWDGEVMRLIPQKPPRNYSLSQTQHLSL